MSTPRRPKMAELLHLEAHPEGGWFKETWRSAVQVTPSGYDGERATATAIYFVLGPGEESRWHRVASAELWLWHAGVPLALTVGGTGTAAGSDVTEYVLGGDVAAGQRPQALVPPGAWQSARPVTSGEVLVSCVVSPGFEFDDFELI